MRVNWIELRDFRNHADTRLEVPEGLIVAVGPNGEGKSNLLEAFYFMTTLSSPRVSSSQPLVRKGSDAAYLRGEFQSAEGRALVEVEIPAEATTRVRVDRSPVRRKRDLRRRLRSVFFGPDDIAIVQADPSERRRFMDDAVVSLWPHRETPLRAYDRALRQRNKLLKSWEGGGAPAGIGAWDAEIVASGSQVTRLRAEAVDRLSGPASEDFVGTAGYGLEIGYRPSVWGEPLEKVFLERLAQRRADELVRRTTLVGPHRDDLHMAARDLVARGFASHGEAWVAALSLRLGLAAAVEEETGEPPLLLLDDPFSALDPVRRNAVAARLLGRGQTLVSTADEDHVPGGAAVVWEVTGGVVTVRGAAA